MAKRGRARRPGPRGSHSALRRHWPALRFVLGIGIVALAAWVLASHTDELSGLQEVFTDLNWWWVPAAVLAEVASFVCFAGMQLELLKCGGLDGTQGSAVQDDTGSPGPCKLIARRDCRLRRVRVPMVQEIRSRRPLGRLDHGGNAGRSLSLTGVGGDNRFGFRHRRGCLPRPDSRHRRSAAGDHGDRCPLRLRATVVPGRHRGNSAPPGPSSGDPGATPRLTFSGSSAR